MESTSVRDVYHGLGVKQPYNVTTKPRRQDATRTKIRSIFSAQVRNVQDPSSVCVGSARKDVQPVHEVEPVILSPTKHTGVSFPRAANRPLSGIGDRAQFLRMRDEDTGHIVIVKVRLYLFLVAFYLD